MTRTSVALVLLGILAACGREEPAQEAAPDSAPAGVATDPPVDSCVPAARPAEREYVDPEPAALAALAGRARRDSTGLHLSTSNGGEVLLTDRTDDSESGDEFIRYGLVAWHPELNTYEVAVGYYEGGATLLIDGRSGHRTKIWATPLESPDRRRLIAASMDMEATFDPNGFQIWRTDGDTLALEWQRETTDWGPTNPRWINDSTMAVRSNPAPSAPDTTSHCVFVRRRAGQWEIATP
jgi:hypothetical protein